MRIDVRGRVSDPAAAWARLGDTDFLNRHAGAGAIRMRIERTEAGPTVLGEMEGVLGAKMSFVERASAWVYRRWFLQERVYQQAPVASTRFELVLEPAGDGVVPRMILDIEPASDLAAPALSERADVIRSRWQPVLDRLPAPGEPDPGQALRTLGADAIEAFARWERMAPAAVVQGVRRIAVEGREVELRRLRSTAVADRLGLDRDEVLVAMLRGVKAGALEVYFSVRCGRCSGQVEAHKALSNLADHAECPSCGIAFAPDLSESVEVLFAPHPSVVPRVDERFCTMNPGGAPEIRASFHLDPGESVEEPVELSPGRWRLGPGGAVPDQILEVGAAGSGEARWEAGGSVAVRAGSVRIGVRNDGTRRQRLILASAEPSTEPVPASRVAMLAEFRRDIGPAVLAPNVRIGARSVAILFTDLSGSTRMYEQLGDARAYGLVRDHFAIVERSVDQHGGLRIKTIGDAVMASFHTAADAMTAALEARDAFAAWIDQQAIDPPPRLNVGVHVGPALAVHSDVAGFDWFGRTVNLASRTQGAATDGALVFTDEVLDDPRVRAILGDRPIERIDADLKGIGQTRLHRIR